LKSPKKKLKKAGPDSLAARTRERLENAYTILSSATTKEGKPFNIIRLPAAEEIFLTLKPGVDTFDAALDMKRVDVGHEGEPIFDKETQKNRATFVAAISYANFIITNNIILIPAYWEPGYPEIMREKDEKVKMVIQEVFPNHKIVQVKDTVYIGLGGGGMHCITKHIPAISNHHTTVFSSANMKNITTENCKQNSITRNDPYGAIN
jgi:agmatine deiminase